MAMVIMAADRIYLGNGDTLHEVSDCTGSEFMSVVTLDVLILFYCRLKWIDSHLQEKQNIECQV